MSPLSLKGPAGAGPRLPPALGAGWPLLTSRPRLSPLEAVSPTGSHSACRARGAGGCQWSQHPTQDSPATLDLSQGRVLSLVWGQGGGGG